MLPVSSSTPAIPRGRFAPSPTGPLHFGSIVAALGSCLEARRQGGEWLIRMEDVDEPRCHAGADKQILETLEALGFAWDGPVMYQSQRKERYREVLAQLKEKGYAYPCACSRKDLADAPPAVDGSPRYPGTCRNGLPPGAAPRAWRLRVNDEPVGFEDAVQGPCTQQLERDVGDFVLLRADGFFAYQLAVVVDDADQGITHVVRGADLLDSTPRQIYLQRLLGVPVPAYTHLPVAVNAAGEKLSKQTRAEAVDVQRPVASLLDAWSFLGQRVTRYLDKATVEEFWSYALENWEPARIPRLRTAAAPE
ncbi:MAG TPA: tRNA glutamyl-Q(34) synthetase GluQRS [Rhodocyclaceae bacterium]|nr:tRNA glutamyl-Q(34) synthetase GluQRS [Rhodocyclaceae bacterium]